MSSTSDPRDVSSKKAGSPWSRGSHASGDGGDAKGATQPDPEEVSAFALGLPAVLLTVIVIGLGYYLQQNVLDTAISRPTAAHERQIDETWRRAEPKSASVSSIPSGCSSASSLARFQACQVDAMLSPSFRPSSSDGVWMWDQMINSCTQVLMYGSPEQDPGNGAVRFTEDAMKILRGCAVTKGFVARSANDQPPSEPITLTVANRIEVVDKVLSGWNVDHSPSGMSLERRNQECASLIGVQPEWRFMLAREPDWKNSLSAGEGKTAMVTAILVACAEARGFGIKPEKRGSAARALNDAARAETSLLVE